MDQNSILTKEKQLFTYDCGFWGSMAGVTTRNVSYIASAMHQVSNYDPESLNVSNVSF